MGKDAYAELIFQLGDLARERLGAHPGSLQPMSAVIQAERTVLLRRQETTALERSMDDEEAQYHAFKASSGSELESLRETTKRWRRVTGDVERVVKDLRKKIARKRHEAEDAETEIARIQQDSAQRDSVKTVRMQQMRATRELGELQAELARVFSPAASDPGAEGLLAYRRTLELEEQQEDRKRRLDERLATLDLAVRQKLEEAKLAEELLDEALFRLGEEVYRLRLGDPAFAALYPKLDKAAAKRRA